jgi:hypothetical protein
MKLKLLLSTLVIVAIGFFSSAQSTINITTTGGSYMSEKWVSITDMADGAGTQIWGQGDGTYGDAQGLINQDIMISPGTYWVNCYDRYADGWDGTTIDVTANGASIGNNGGASPNDGTDNDASSSWETPADELEASFMIVVSSPPACLVPTAVASSNITAASADFSWTASASETGGYHWEVVPQGDAQGVNVVSSGTTATGALTVSASGLSSATPYDFYIRTDCGATGMSTWAGPVVFTTLPGPHSYPLSENFETGFDLFDNASGNDVDFSVSTTYFHTGTQSVHNAHGNSNNNALMQTGILDLSTALNPELKFWQIAKTEGDYDVGYVQISIDGGATYVALPPSAYSGNSLDYGTRGYFHEDSYALWGTGSQTPDNATWWQEEVFSLNAYKVANVRIRFLLFSDGSGNRQGWFIDDLTIAEGPSAPECVTNPTPIDGAIDVPVGDITLTWDAPATGPTPTSYDLYAGSMSDGSDFSLVSNFSSNTATVTISGYDTQIYYRVISKNGFSEATGCSIWSFTTQSPPAGALCENPLDVASLPYNTAGNTNSFGDDYSGSAGASCSSASSYLDGDDVVYAYTATADGTFNITVSDLTQNYAGVFVYDSCASIGTTCLDGDTNSFSTADLSVDITATNGNTYYIVISTWASPQSTAYTMDITRLYIWDGTAWNATPEGSITSDDSMIVQSGTMPSLSAAISVNNLTIETGASIEAASGDVSVAGNVVNNGAITGVNQVVLNSATAAVSGTGTMTNLTVGASGVVTVTGSQSITSQLDVVSGGTLNANGNITLVSNALGTARVDEMDAGAIVGDVNVERYIPAGNRAYRFIGPTVSGQTVFNSWQEAGNNAVGLGVQVTGTAGTVGVVNATSGHDETLSGSASMFKWDPAGQAWTTVANTKTEVLNAGAYYRLFVRGDRATDLSNNPATQTATTLRASGSLMQTSMVVTPAIANGEFFAVANPYQSKVSMATTATGTAADMYYWDPNLGMNGGYAAIDITTGMGTAGMATNVLDAGQAVFFLDASAAASVTITQTNKVSGNNNAGVFSTSTLQQALRLKLYQTSRYNNNQSESDGLYVDFDAAHNLNVDSNDAVKLNGLNVNMAIEKPTGERLAVERRTLPTTAETINLNISNYLTTNYTMVAAVDVLPGLTAYMKDNLNGNRTELVQGTSTPVHFTIDTTNAQSIEASRFEIVFELVTLGHEDIAFGDQLTIYPNPVHGDVVTIRMDGSSASSIEVAVFNTLGQQVMTRSYDQVTNSIQIDNLSSLSKGMYFVKISKDSQQATLKFIKE